jgi:hypothetical protein
MAAVTDSETFDRLTAALEQPVLSAVDIRTSTFTDIQRKIHAIRAGFFVLGFVLALSGGFGWVLISAVAVAHFVWRRDRLLLASGTWGLGVVHLTRNSADVKQTWTPNQRATLVLRRDEPDMALRIGPRRLGAGTQEWLATANGLDLDHVERVIQQGGTEVLRTVERS